MKPNRESRAAFTLIELLASMAILSLIMVMLFSAFEQINRAWLQGENRVETFTQARAVLDLMSRELSQAIATSKITFHGEDHAVYFIAPVNADHTGAGNQADLCEVGYVFVNTPITQPTTLTRHLTESIDSEWDFYGNATWWTSSHSSRDATLANGSILKLSFQYLNANGTLITTPITDTKVPYAIVISLDAVDSRTLERLKAVKDPTGQSSPQIKNPAVRNFTTTVYLPNALP